MKDSTPTPTNSQAASPSRDTKGFIDVVTPVANSTAATFTFIGYWGSFLQGVVRTAAIVNGDKTSQLGKTLEAGIGKANDYAMPVARGGYVTSAGDRSLARDITTFPEGFTDKGAQRDAEISKDWSKVSTVLTVGVLTSIVCFSKKRVSSYEVGTFKRTALDILRGPWFNAASGAGTLGAWYYNRADHKQAGVIMEEGSSALMNEYPTLPRDIGLKIAKSSVPHMTDQEYCAKGWAYGVSIGAAACGLGGVAPIIFNAHKAIKVAENASKAQKLASKVIETIMTESTAKKIADWGGRGNGVGYLNWPFSVALTYERYDNAEERRLPEHMDAMWNKLHKRAIIESIGIAALTGATMVVFAKSPVGSKARDITDIMLNKMDVIVGGGLGTAELVKAAYEKAPELMKQVEALPDEKDASYASQVKKLVEKNPLLESAFYARSVWIGRRLTNARAVNQYLKNTNPLTNTQEEIDTYVMEVARNLPEWAAISDLESRSPKEVRVILEEGRCIKPDPSNEMANKNISQVRNVCDAAHYVAEMRRKAERWVADNQLAKQASSLQEKHPDDTPKGDDSIPSTLINSATKMLNRMADGASRASALFSEAFRPDTKVAAVIVTGKEMNNGVGHSPAMFVH